MVMGERICNLCMHRCRLNDGQTGRCRARKNADGKVICGNYGKITSLALDPIEKKPLRKFLPEAAFCRWGVMDAICPALFVRIMKYP